MQSKTNSKQLHRIPAGLAVATALVLLAATIAVAMALTIDRSASDIRATRTASIAIVHPRANPRFTEINELHALIERPESDATINQHDRMNFLEMNALPGDAAFVPPTMEMYAGRQ